MTNQLRTDLLQIETRSSGPKHAHLQNKIKLQHIVDALVEAGHDSLDDQARALGVSRSTAWTIVRVKHKLDRLSAKTTNQMLSNPSLPPTVRSLVEKYVLERTDKLRLPDTTQR
jgi:hypothetical protein